MKDKKGAELTIGTIVIIVLALVVLVVLVLGFTGGWGNLWSRITSIFGGGANVDSVVQACQVACSTESKYDYCTRERTIMAESNVFIGNETTKKLYNETERTGETPNLKEAIATCKQLADLHSSLGFQPCSIDCA